MLLFACERSKKSYLPSDLLAINLCMTSGTFLKKFGKNMENLYTCAACVHILFLKKNDKSMFTQTQRSQK